MWSPHWCIATRLAGNRSPNFAYTTGTHLLTGSIHRTLVHTTNKQRETNEITEENRSSESNLMCVLVHMCLPEILPKFPSLSLTHPRPKKNQSTATVQYCLPLPNPHPSFHKKKLHQHKTSNGISFTPLAS